MTRKRKLMWSGAALVAFGLASDSPSHNNSAMAYPPDDGNMLVNSVTPPMHVTSTLAAEPNGIFIIPVEVNGHTILTQLDTGAKITTATKDQAELFGVNPRGLNFNGGLGVRTANGDVRATVRDVHMAFGLCDLGSQSVAIIDAKSNRTIGMPLFGRNLQNSLQMEFIPGEKGDPGLLKITCSINAPERPPSAVAAGAGSYRTDQDEDVDDNRPVEKNRPGVVRADLSRTARPIR